MENVWKATEFKELKRLRTLLQCSHHLHTSSPIIHLVCSPTKKNKKTKKNLKYKIK